MSLPVKNQKKIRSNAQTLSFFYFKYIRVLTDHIDEAEVTKLKKKYWYVFIYSYRKLNLPDFNLKEQVTVVIDLAQGREKIFGKFKKNTRNEIRKTEDMKCLCFSIPDKDEKKSYNFYKKVKVRDKVNPDIREEFKGCLFFNAYFKKTIIVSVSCYSNKSTLRLKHIVSSRKAGVEEGKLAGYATRRIIWEICKYGKSHGYKKLDLAGANLTDPKKAGIAKFKQSFGGDIQTMYTYRYQRKLFTAIKETVGILGKNIN
ncbi:MAG: hypothetical protein ISR98_02280 [Parcubacteria group bacterium]|nr:hypothetical protein [Parcubacteria group bacterium]